MVCLLHRARVKNSPGPSAACSNTNPCASASSAQASSKPASTPGPASPCASWTTIKNCSTSAAPHQYAPGPAHYKVIPGSVGTRCGVGWMRGPGAQYISLTLFKHNNCSSFLRSNLPLLETILMSVSGVSEMYWAWCLSCLIRRMIQWQGKTIVTDIGQNEENGNP